MKTKFDNDKAIAAMQALADGGNKGAAAILAGAKSYRGCIGSAINDALDGNLGKDAHRLASVLPDTFGHRLETPAEAAQREIAEKSHSEKWDKYDADKAVVDAIHAAFHSRIEAARAAGNCERNGAVTLFFEQGKPFAQEYDGEDSHHFTPMGFELPKYPMCPI